MKQTALEQLKKTPLVCQFHVSTFPFLSCGSRFCQRRNESCKEWHRSQNYICEGGLYDEHGQGETPQAISWCIWHWAANKGFIFTPVTALLPRTAFGFLLLSCRVNLPLTGGSGWCRCRRTAPGTASPGVIAATRSPSSPPTPPNFSW